MSLSYLAKFGENSLWTSSRNCLAFSWPALRSRGVSRAGYECICRHAPFPPRGGHGIAGPASVRGVCAISTKGASMRREGVRREGGRAHVRLRTP